MKKHKLIAPCFIALLLLLSNCKQNLQKKKTITKIEKLSEPILKSLNETSIVKQDNVFVIDQVFAEKNNQNNSLGNPVEVDLSLTSGAMISAFSEYKEDYTISYKTLENNSWSDWVELKENKEVVNPKRKVFSPKNLTNSVKKIQFKSNQITNNKVIFRIYTFQKQ